MKCNEADIISIATHFRDAIEKYVKYQPVFYLSHFPAGACGHTSYMLGAYLHKRGFGDFNYICGESQGKSHAWLEKDGLIVDITSDQFNGCPRVYVGKRNGFYKKFRICNKHLWNASLDGQSIETDRLYSAYVEIIKNIQD